MGMHGPRVSLGFWLGLWLGFGFGLWLGAWSSMCFSVRIDATLRSVLGLRVILLGVISASGF